MNFHQTSLPSKTLKSYFNRTNVIILLVWVLVNGFFLTKNGIVTTGEAEKYISQADSFIRTGRLSSSNYWFYFTQIFLIAVSLKFHLGFLFVVAVQLLINLCATFSFYKILLFVCENKKVGLLGTLILEFNQPYQEFNSFLQTESIFFSLMLIFAFYVIHTKKLSFQRISGILLWMLLIGITRPTGFLLMLPVFLYLWFMFLKNLGFFAKTSVALAVVVVFFYFLDKALGSGGGLDFLLPFKKEMIICGVPSLKSLDVTKEIDKGNSLYGLFEYVTHHFGQFIQLAGSRTEAFFGLYRNYYSTTHNIYLITYFYILHLLGLCGIFSWPKSKLAPGVYFFSIIIITWLTVILTCDDWHNRFYLSVSPFIIIFAVSFISTFLKWRKAF